MPVTFRVVLRSTETQPSQQTQESVLPAMSQKFGQQVSITAPDDRLGAATIGTVDTDAPAALRDVYEYVKPHRLVKVGAIRTNDDSRVAVRKAHEIDREAVERHERATVLGEVHGDLLVRVRRGDE